MSDHDESDPVDRATHILYSGPPDQFIGQRSTLAKAARERGDPDAASAITALRRPTAAAAVVNRFARATPGSTARLLDVGARLRSAHEALDASQLRELSTVRRALVAELSRQALDAFGPESPSTALRDDVSNSFDAAVADPEIAGRLGTLVRPEHWSGFGVATSGPGLTLVRGGRNGAKPRKRGSSTARTDPEPGRPATAKPSTADRRRSNRVLGKARDAFARAEDGLAAAQQDEQAGLDQVRTLTEQIAELSRRLADAKRQLESSRTSLKSARARRREARSALDRAERNAATD